MKKMKNKKQAVACLLDYINSHDGMHAVMDGSHLIITIITIGNNDDYYMIIWRLSGMDYSDIYSLYNKEALNSFIDLYTNGIISINDLARVTGSPSQVFGAYVKDSYRDGFRRLSNIVKGDKMGVAIAKSIINKIDKLQYNNASARIYKQMYITPDMLRSCRASI